MKFVDQAKVYINSGNGGAGCVSFRREKFIPRGGPDGGNGGKGGDVILEATSQKDTLLHFHLNQHFKAGNGRPGEGRKRSGKDGEDAVLIVPPGTIVFEEETGNKICDLKNAGDRHVIAKGGRGGLGNYNFASGSNRSPRYAQPGEAGMEQTRIILELRLLADAGLLGYPNVGKSTLISKISAAKPKIADYPFTTLIPNLGVVSVENMHDPQSPNFVLADLPGLIDGAAEGAGLGHRFLKHLSRCSVLVHIIDPLRVKAENPLEDLNNLNRELKRFDEKLSQKKQIISLSKMDLAEGEPALKLLTTHLPQEIIYPFSAVTGLGLQELKRAIWQIIKDDKENKKLLEEITPPEFNEEEGEEDEFEN